MRGNKYSMRSLTCTTILILVYNIASSDCNSVEDAFHMFMIAPNTVPVAPKSLLTVRFGNKEANLGNDLQPYEVAYPPLMSFEADPKKLYTLIIVDLDQPSILVPSQSPYLSLLRINIPGANIPAGDYISPYVPPSPTPGSQYHRFVYLVYKQTGRIEPNSPELLKLPTSFNNFPLSTFVSHYNLTDPVAGNFYLTQMEICNTQPTTRNSHC